ncbi:MAG TPA: DUF4114 domain-containing protein [Mucilaginibacter sp.]|nr:DUF4114 domain-containing protein [Mucilaginibacter sp.]
MKNNLLLLIIAIVAFSCKKELAPVTVPVQFNETTYVNLGKTDTTGKPLYLETPDVISNDLLDFLHSYLPEHQNVSNTHPELLSSSAIGELKITQTSTVHLTFVSQGAGFADAIAFYTYPTNNPPATAADIKTITYVFPNAGYNSPLNPGDKVNIGTFASGTSVGFVLMKNAFNLITHTLNNNATHFCSNDVLNPEVDPKLKKHAVLINYTPENKTLIGFEDLDRTDPNCDDDFNDVVIYATITN